jgi:multiple sugar transport system ATP-binding protein
MANVKISGLHKSFGGVQAVRGVDLDIPDREFTVLVGPSGCGKSTLLRSIAGLEDVEQGTIEIGGQVVNGMRPRDRDVAMVFQDYALYPHMTVFGNISLSLRARGTPKPEIEARVNRAAEMLGIRALLARYPRQLSGGQRQRVAIGRAIVRNPRVFLFDEPLSNLDAQLRDEMRGEIKRLHQEIATTMIYVTHDQIEAMTLADRIVLLREGKIEQQGAPLDLFERPASLFVAGFLGSPKMNFLQGRLVRSGGAYAIDLGEEVPKLALPPGRAFNGATDGAKVILGLRPEHVGRAAGAQPAPGSQRLEATIELVQPTGSRSYASFRLAGQPVLSELQAHDVSGPGERITIDLNLPRATVFDPETGRAL